MVRGGNSRTRGSAKEMMPKTRQRSRSESDACEVAVNQIDENHFKSPRTRNQDGYWCKKSKTRDYIRIYRDIRES